jgi:hypothetical protein
MLKKIMAMLFAYCLLFSLLAQAEDDVPLPGDTQMPSAQRNATMPKLPRMVNTPASHTKPVYRKKQRKVHHIVRHPQHLRHAKPPVHPLRHVKKHRGGQAQHTVSHRHQKARHFKIKRHGHH